MKGLTEVTLGNGLKVIPFEAFYDCSKLTKVNLPSSLEKIEDSAFTHCSNLPKLNLPSSLEEIEASAFTQCRNLSELIIPASLTKIKFTGTRGTEEGNNRAFRYCQKLPFATRQRLKDLGYGSEF